MKNSFAINPKSIWVKYSLIVLRGGGKHTLCLSVELLIGQKLPNTIRVLGILSSNIIRRNLSSDEKNRKLLLLEFSEIGKIKLNSAESFSEYFPWYFR